MLVFHVSFEENSCSSCATFLAYFYPCIYELDVLSYQYSNFFFFSGRLTENVVFNSWGRGGVPRVIEGTEICK